MKLLAALALVVVAACTATPIASLPSPSSVGGSQPSPTEVATTPEPAGQAGGGSTVEPSPSPSPPAPAPVAKPAFAVLVDLFPGGVSYDIAIVGSDGQVVARAHAHKRSTINDASELPYVSTSNSRVYYLDGDRNVRYLKADGTSGLAATVSGGPQVHAAFAVTPDDSRIAVALLDYALSPVQLTLYVEDLSGAHHSVIFTSNSHYVWPAGWHSGQLVVAYLGPSATPFNSKTYNYSSRNLAQYPYGPNPYGGINYHVISPVTAQREAIISGGGASGLPTRAGTAVVQGDGVDWNGRPLFWNSPNDYGSYSAAGSLSPDGNVIAACCDQPGASGQLVLWYPGGGTTVLPVTITSGDWAGWFDSTHLVTGFYQRADGTPTVVDIGSKQVVEVNAHGIVAAMLPAGLDS